MTMTLLNPMWMWGLLAAAVLALVVALGAMQSARMRRRFFAQSTAKTWARASSASRRRAWAGVLGACAIGAIALGLARPAHDPRPRPVEQTVRDVVFVIDVSRSMLAEDLRPTRLSRAVLAVNDVLDIVRGDRVGIVAFAGSALTVSPLTTDYSFARLRLTEISPKSVPRGGTAIGEGIRAATQLMFVQYDSAKTPPPRHSRTIVIMTDGEDQGSEPIEAARAAAERGVRIVTIGLGSEFAGATVPAWDGIPGNPSNAAAARATPLTYRGETVQSRMDPRGLEAIAQSTPGGLFLNVGTGNLEMDRVYSQLMKSEQSSSVESKDRIQYSELFQIALGFALVLLLVEGVVYARTK